MMYKQNIVIFLIAIICMRNKRLKDRNILQTKTYKPFLLQILGAKDFHSYPLLYIARQLIIDLNFKKNSQAKQLRKTNRTRKLYTEQMSKIYVKPKVIYTDKYYFLDFSGILSSYVIYKYCYHNIWHFFNIVFRVDTFHPISPLQLRIVLSSFTIICP